MSEIIQVKDSKVVVFDVPDDGLPTELSTWPIRISEDIENSMMLSVKGLAPGEQKVIAVTGMEYIRGFFLHASGRVKVLEDASIIAEGKDIHIIDADMSEITVEALYDKFTTGVIKTVSDTELTIEDANFVNSRLISTEIIGPFPAINEYTYTLKLGQMEITGITLSLDAGDPEVGITGDEVAAGFTEAINSILGRTAVLMTYDGTNKNFVLKALDNGAHSIDFYGTSAIYIGMDSPTLSLGTVDITGMKVEALNGDGEGLARAIVSSIDNTITLESALTGLAVGDMVKIYDDSVNVEIDISVLLYQ